MPFYIVSLFGNLGRNMIGCDTQETGVFNEPTASHYDKRFLNVKNIFDKRMYTMDDEDRTAWELISMIPKDSAVTASGDLLPALSSRKKLYEFALNHPQVRWSIIFPSGYPIYDVDYILINRRCIINGLGGHYAFFEKSDLEREIAMLTNRYNFRILINKGNFTLLKKNHSKIGGRISQ